MRRNKPFSDEKTVKKEGHSGGETGGNSNFGIPGQESSEWSLFFVLSNPKVVDDYAHALVGTPMTLEHTFGKG